MGNTIFILFIVITILTFAEISKHMSEATAPGTTGKLKKSNEERYTVVIDSALLDEVRSAAHWDRAKIKDLFNLAVGEYLHKWKHDKAKKEYVGKDGKVKPPNVHTVSSDTETLSSGSPD